MDKKDKLKVIKKKMGRPPKIDTIQRTREIAAMLLEARPRSEIIKYCCDNYGVQESTVGNIVKIAYRYIANTHAVERDMLVSTHIQHYYDIYRQAKTLGDSRGAIAALNSIEKLLKLHNPDVAVQTNNINLNLKDLTTNELRELLQVKD